MQLRRDISIVALALTCISGSVWACPEAPAVSAASVSSTSRTALLSWKPRAWKPPARGTALANGLRVSIDPVDGAFSMPSADELPAGDLRIDDATPREVLRRADGSVRATLDERFEEFEVVKLGKDGKPTWTCVHGPQGAAQFLRSATATAPVPMPGTVWEDK
jgi:hypothetical protein